MMTSLEVSASSYCIQGESFNREATELHVLKRQVCIVKSASMAGG
ncbi:hypothetical protein ACP3VU_01175 [Vibrio sp. PNB23_22_6]